MHTFLERLATVMARRRWWVVGAWFVILIVGMTLAARIGDVTTTEVSLPGTESQRGIELIEDNFAAGDYTSVQPVFRSRTLTVSDVAYREAVTASLERAARVVPGTEVISTYSSGSRDFVGDDGHLTYATLRLPISSADAKAEVADIRAALGTLPGFETTLLGGQAAVDADTTPIFDDDLKKAEMIAFPLALLILLFVFGGGGRDRDRRDGCAGPARARAHAHHGRSQLVASGTGRPNRAGAPPCPPGIPGRGVSA